MLAVSTPTKEHPVQGWNPFVLDADRAQDTSKFHHAPSQLPGTIALHQNVKPSWTYVELPSNEKLNRFSYLSGQSKKPDCFI